MKKEIKKEMTIEDLALLMNKGFKKVENLIEQKIDELADSTAKGFESVGARFDKVENDISVLKKDVGILKEDMAEVKGDIQIIRRDILKTDDRFPSQFAFDQLSSRVSSLEEKAKEKKK